MMTMVRQEEEIKQIKKDIKVLVEYLNDTRLYFKHGKLFYNKNKY